MVEPKKPEKANEEEIEQGFISDDEGEREIPQPSLRPRRVRPRSMVSTYKPILLVGAAILLIAYLMIGVVAVSKSDFTKNIQDMLATIDSVRAGATSGKVALDKAIADLPATISAKVTEATQGIAAWQGQTDASIADSNRRIDTLEGNVSTVTNGVNDAIALANEAKSSAQEVKTWQAQVNASVSDTNQDLLALEARVLKLEERLKDSPTPESDGIDVDVRPLTDALITALDEKSISAQMKLTLTNETAENIDDVIVTLTFQTESLPISSSTVASLSSSPAMSWLGGGWYIDTAEYRNNWGLSIDANKSKTIYVTLKFTDTVAVFTRTAYGYQVEVDVDY